MFSPRKTAKSVKFTQEVCKLEKSLYFCVKFTQEVNTEEKRIVVMGGSFNPPTLAHYKLMKVAIAALEADMGLFVPVSDAYLRRKLSHNHPPIILSPELRVAMLWAMSEDDRMAVCEKEIGTIEPRTVPTLKSLQEDYPKAELYFLMGADKLDLLVHLNKSRRFLDEFKVVLFSREGKNIEETLRAEPSLSEYLHRIVILPQPEGLDTISSSEVRKRMLEGESCREMLCAGVWELFKKLSPADFPDMIRKFKGENAFLGNRFSCKFIWKGERYGSVEAAVLKEKESMSSYEWECNCIDIMEAIVRAKFEQNTSLMESLVKTGKCLLVNGNRIQETFWGVDLYSWQGENHLGKILMKIRDKE